MVWGWIGVLFMRAPGNVGLPTYAFQRERYWLASGGGDGGVGDAAAIGLSRAEHPLLGALVALADEKGWLFTGRISLADHPWLADHAVLGSVLLPGTAFLDMALWAGQRVGCGAVRELTLEAPLVVGGEHGDAVQIQLSVGEPDEDGQRSVLIHSRPQDRGEDTTEEQGTPERSWTRHASGTLALTGNTLNGHATSIAQRAAGLSVASGGSWPPPDAQTIDIDGLYDALIDQGLEYGPVFQGLQNAWRHENELYAEITLTPDQQDQAHIYAIHPALLDSALHTALTTLPSEGPVSKPKKKRKRVAITACACRSPSRVSSYTRPASPAHCESCSPKPLARMRSPYS